MEVGLQKFHQTILYCTTAFELSQTLLDMWDGDSFQKILVEYQKNLCPCTQEKPRDAIYLAAGDDEHNHAFPIFFKEHWDA